MIAPAPVLYYCRSCGKRRRWVKGEYLLCSQCGSTGMCPCYLPEPLTVTCPVRGCDWHGWADGHDDQLPIHLAQRHPEYWLKRLPVWDSSIPLQIRALRLLQKKPRSLGELSNNLRAGSHTLGRAMRQLEAADLVLRVHVGRGQVWAVCTPPRLNFPQRGGAR